MTQDHLGPERFDREFRQVEGHWFDPARVIAVTGGPHGQVEVHLSAGQTIQIELNATVDNIHNVAWAIFKGDVNYRD